ncbi:MAG: glycosyltransferase family 4 protein [Acidobacteriaceae bacterium]|nr:glycosyltransferase family 4 protein [Acidobacteriaceae bacterium]
MAASKAKRGAVAHLLPWLNIGGTELQTLRLAQAARELGYENSIYVPAGGTKVRALFEDEHFPVFEYDQVQPSYTKPSAFWKNSRRLARAFRERGIQIVHCSDILAAHFAGFAGRMAGARVISHVRNHYPGIGRRERGFLLPVELFVCVSKNTRDNFGIERGRRRSTVLYDVPGVIYKPVEDRAGARASFGLPPQGQVFGMAARVSPQKDFPTLIQAARIVLDKMPEASFLIAGDHRLEAPHRAHYESLLPLLDETHTRENFFFAGFQSEMSTFYAAIDTFVLSSNWEGLPTVVLEAMLYGRPAVSTEVGGIAEAIHDGVDGFLVPPKSPGVLADRLLQLATDEALRQRFIQNAQRSLTETFGQKRFLKQVDELYSGLLRRR